MGAGNLLRMALRTLRESRKQAWAEQVSCDTVANGDLADSTAMGGVGSLQSYPELKQ